MSASPYINFKSIYDNLQDIDVDTFFEATIGGMNTHGSVHYLSLKYNKNFLNNDQDPVYRTMWGYSIAPEDRVYFNGINARTDQKSGKLYLSGSIPKDKNVAHTAVSDFLVNAVISALKRAPAIKTSNNQGKVILTKILGSSDFPSITFKPHYSEHYVSKESSELVPMEQPRATFEFDGMTWPSSDKVPTLLSGQVKTRIYTVATRKDYELMKERGLRVAAKIEPYLPSEDDDDEEASKKFINLCRIGRIPQQWDCFKNRPATVIGGSCGYVFGDFNFPGNLQIFGGNIRLKPSFGACTFIPGGDSGEGGEILEEDEELATFSRVIKSSKVLKAATKGNGKLADDSDEEEEEEEKATPKKGAAKKAASKSLRNIDDEDDEEEEEEKPVAKKSAAKKKAPVVVEEDDEDEVTVKTPPKKSAAKKKVVEDDDEEEEEKVVPKKAAAKKKVVEEDDDEEEEPKKPAKKTAAKKPAAKKKIVVEDEDDDEE